MDKDKNYLDRLVNLIVLIQKHKKYINYFIVFWLLLSFVLYFNIYFEATNSSIKSMVKATLSVMMTYFSGMLSAWIGRIASGETQLRQTDFNLLSIFFSFLLDEISVEESIGDAIEYSQDRKRPLINAYIYLVPLLIMKAVHRVTKSLLLLGQWVIQLVNK